MGKARDAAMEYFRCMRERDADGIEALFAADSFVSIYGGTLSQGQHEIREYYEKIAMPSRPRPMPQEPIEEGNRCAVEIMVRLPDGSLLRATDIFTVDDDGRVTSLRLYMGDVLEEDARAVD